MRESIVPVWVLETDEPIPIDLPEDEQVELVYKHMYVSDANDAYAWVVGLERGEQIAGMRISDFMPSSIPENLDNVKKLVRARYNIQDMETTESYEDGEWRVYLNSFMAVIEDGKLLRGWGTSRDITSYKKAIKELQDAYTEIEKLKDRLEAESAYLQDEIKLEHNFESIIGQSEALKYVLHRVEMAAPTDSPVLIMGETGTGKELVARALHKLSLRGKRALVKVNCAALPATLIESELFGHAKGAFTGADKPRVGRFHLADGATLFLDEISEIPLELQAKLLRVLQDGEFEPLGSSGTMRVNVRIIAASNRDLEEEVREGRFREDLYYRINVFPLTVPPLRNRKEDIPLLVTSLVNSYNRKMNKNVTKIPTELISHLQAYDWPGNVRELENVIERAMITSRESVLKLPHKLIKSKGANQIAESSQTLAEVERKHILEMLEHTGWRIEGKNGSANLLGIAPSTLRDRMKKLGIRRSAQQ